VKRAFAILFSMLLVVTQGALPLSARAADDSAACASCKCHCKTVSCCPAPSTPRPQPAPLSTQNGKSQRDFQLLPAAAHFSLYIQTFADSDFSPLHSSRNQATSVPLYTRTCSLVI
jgi:hypothetical protein